MQLPRCPAASLLVRHQGHPAAGSARPRPPGRPCPSPALPAPRAREPRGRRGDRPGPAPRPACSARVAAPRPLLRSARAGAAALSRRGRAVTARVRGAGLGWAGRAPERCCPPVAAGAGAKRRGGCAGAGGAGRAPGRPEGSRAALPAEGGRARRGSSPAHGRCHAERPGEKGPMAVGHCQLSLQPPCGSSLGLLLRGARKAVPGKGICAAQRAPSSIAGTVSGLGLIPAWKRPLSRRVPRAGTAVLISAELRPRQHSQGCSRLAMWPRRSPALFVQRCFFTFGSI